MGNSAKDQVKRALTDPQARAELEDEKGDRAKITPIGVEQRMSKAFADPTTAGLKSADSDAAGSVRSVTGAEFRDRGSMLVDTTDTTNVAASKAAQLHDRGEQLTVSGAEGTNVAASKAAQLHDRGEMLVVSDAETNIGASHAAQLHDRGDEMLPISGDVTSGDVTPQVEGTQVDIATDDYPTS